MIGSKLLLIPLWVGFGINALLGEQMQSLRLDLSAQPQSSFLGLGVEFDPYLQPVDFSRWQMMLHHLAYMDPGFLRVMSGADDYCTGFSAEGEPQYRWQTNPNAPELQRVFNVLDFAQQHGVEVYLGEWSPPRGLGITSPADPRWSRIIADFVSYLIRKRHYSVLHHYIFMNEPNGEWMWRGSRPDFDAWASGVRQLRRELDARGLQSVLLTGPDNSGDRDWFRRSVTQLHDTFGEWEEHIYAKDEEVSSGGIEKMLLEDARTLATLDPHPGNKNRFVAESGLETGKLEELDQQPRVHDFEYGARMADYVVQIARAGWGRADAWDLDDAMHTNGRGGQKVWGFFDSGSAAGMQPRPWYYAWTVLSRSMPKGATIVKLHGDDEGPVRSVAATWLSHGKPSWAVILLNHTDKPAQVALQVPKASRREVTIYHYFAEDRPVDRHEEPRAAAVLGPSGAPLELSFPSRGLIVVTTAPPD